MKIVSQIDPVNVVLVVDDEKINRVGTTLTVQNIGYATDEATNGKDAIKKLNENKYSAVLMDLQMPGMSGFECAEQIRTIEMGSGKRIPIIAFSAMSENNIEQKCLDAGMDAFLDKACAKSQLALVLKQLLQIAGKL